MAKTVLNGNLKWVVGAAITILIFVAGVVFAAGGLRRDIEQNTKNTVRIDNEGCKPSVAVRQNQARMEAEYLAMREDLKELKADMKQLIRLSTQ